MKKISVKNIIEFRKKSEKSKKSFLKSLDKVKPITTETGGNYWVRSVSAMSKSFKTNDNIHIKEKIEIISNLYEISKSLKTKVMFQRNLNILLNYENFDFSTWYPNNAFKILDKNSRNSIIEINSIPVQVLPNQIFSFKSNETDCVGAVWFIAKLQRYNEAELGIFSESLFNLLKVNFSKNYEVMPEYCLIIDVLNVKEVTYKMILDNKISALLQSTLKAIKESR